VGRRQGVLGEIERQRGEKEKQRDRADNKNPDQNRVAQLVLEYNVLIKCTLFSKCSGYRCQITFVILHKFLGITIRSCLRFKHESEKNLTKQNSEKLSSHQV
jgi:hypothetical protein